LDLNGRALTNRRLDVQWELAHPLNEYLRFLHDEGALGLALLLIGLGHLLMICRRAFRLSIDVMPSAVSFYLGAYLAFVAVLLTMLTDNTCDYVFTMGPFGVLLGTALRESRRLGANSALTRVGLPVPVRRPPRASLSVGPAI